MTWRRELKTRVCGRFPWPFEAAWGIQWSSPIQGTGSMQGLGCVWEKTLLLTARTAKIFHWVETRGLWGKQGLGWRWSISSAMHKLKCIWARSGREWGEIPTCLHFICALYPDITLSQLFSVPPRAGGFTKHLIQVMTFSPLGPGSPGTPSSPTGPGNPGFP